jgi:hypothetical protein
LRPEPSKTIADPACGTGGFFLAAYDYIVANHNLDKEQKQYLKFKTFYGNEIVAKIPGGSLIDATNCTEWCEVEWQGKKGFAIASAIDRSGRVTVRRAAPRADIVPEEYAVVAPPRVYYRPPVYYYGYRPYYWGVPGPYWGYRRWRYW